ncbi:DDE-type integrase/transposase/recombinase [Rhizophagus irregularis DAOM 181602=DAOM 197198]|nr:DDE-type integrase/transposase/recombinase [Rhizophagus irregularis DAOM 181602=DAOM 197198]
MTLYIGKELDMRMLMHSLVLTQLQLIITPILQPHITIMDEQLYNKLILFLTILTFMDDITDKRKTQIWKNSTQYIYQNNILFRKTKDGIRKRRGPTNRQEELIPIPVKGLFHRIGIDIKGPLPITSSGNRYIIVTMNYFTKWPEARAISNIKAETVAKFIYEKIICRHGVPQEILSDRGTSFMNKLIDELCENYQIKHRLTSAYRLQTNGMVERFNQTIGECIAKLVQDNNKEWD